MAGLAERCAAASPALRRPQARSWRPALPMEAALPAQRVRSERGGQPALRERPGTVLSPADPASVHASLKCAHPRREELQRPIVCRQRYRRVAQSAVSRDPALRLVTSAMMAMTGTASRSRTPSTIRPSMILSPVRRARASNSRSQQSTEMRATSRPLMRRQKTQGIGARVTPNQLPIRKQATPIRMPTTRERFEMNSGTGRA